MGARRPAGHRGNASINDYISVYIYTYIYIYMYICKIEVYTHTYTRPYVHTYIHTYMHACMHACHAYIHTCIHVCICIYTFRSLWTACIHTCIHRCMPNPWGGARSDYLARVAVEMQEKDKEWVGARYDLAAANNLVRPPARLRKIAAKVLNRLNAA